MHTTKNTPSPRKGDSIHENHPAPASAAAQGVAGKSLGRARDKAWAPLTIPAYRSFWIAGLFSNFGTWMHETGSQWLMTSLDPSPEMVAAVRTSMTIPVFCLALPAGVWADRFNRRSWLIASQCLLLAIASLMAVLATLGWITPTWLLLLTAGMGVAMILNQPAWQALTPELVPPALIPSAVQAGSVSFNLARSLGPAVAGLLIANFGVGITFFFNAFSFLGVIAVLIVWQPDLEAVQQRASPQFASELRKGILVIGNSTNIRNVLLRLIVFAAAASILWSLLSLVATQKLGFRTRVWFLPRFDRGRGRYRSMVLARSTPTLFERGNHAGRTIDICLCLCTHRQHELSRLILPGLAVVGACWMTIMTTLNATAQVYLPRSFRARGMAAYMMAFALGMATGAFAWGWLASLHGISTAFVVAGGMLMLAAIILNPLKVGPMHVEVNK